MWFNGRNRVKPEKHPGIKTALKESLKLLIKTLEEMASQASLKENGLETLQPATEKDIKDFLQYA